MSELIILLDAGHGPATPGKRSPDGTLLEFEFNRPTAEKTRSKLLKYENVRVFYIHANETDKPLQERTNYANKIQADNPGAKVIYISIHANAFGSSGFNNSQGIETYAYISRPPGATKLAQNVQAQLISITGRQDRGVKFADFHVLRETDMDAILVEGGFMTNKEELALLKSDAYRDKVAQGITDGIAKTYGLQLKPEPKPAPTLEKAAKEPQEDPVSPLHADAWEWAIEKGITVGGNPAGGATRQQVIQFIYNDNKRKGTL